MKKISSLVLTLVLLAGLVPAAGVTPALAAGDVKVILPATLTDDRGYIWVNEGMATLKVGGLYGFLDRNGNKAIPYMYEGADVFSEGLAAVKKDGKWGAIDKNNNEIIPFEYDDSFYFHDGVAKVIKGGLYGVIDKSGKTIVPFGSYSYSGLDTYRRDGFIFVAGGLYDKNGKEIVQVGKYYYIDDFQDNLARVSVGGKYGAIDKNGNVVVSIEYDNYFSFSEGLALVRKGGKYGFVNSSGTRVIECIYDWAYDFSEGLASVWKDGKGGFINKSGAEVIPLRQDCGYCPFIEGVSVGVNENGQWRIIDKTGNTVCSLDYEEVYYDGWNPAVFIVEKNGKFGLIDKTDNEILPVEYDYVCDILWDDNNAVLFEVEKNGEWGVVDATGKFIVELVIDGFGEFYDRSERVIGFAFEKNGYVGFVDISGKVIAPTERKYDDVWYDEDMGLLWYEINRKYGLLDMDGKELLGAEYQWLAYAGNGNFFFEQNNKWGVLHISGVGGGSGIDYFQADVIIPGAGASGFSINLSKETITTGYTVKAFSIDGGTKWKPVKDALSAAKFPKLFNKNLDLKLSDKDIDKKTKQPAEGAVIVSFPTINKRPAAPKLTINYLIAADPFGDTPGDWVLAEKNGTTAVKADILIGVASGKNVNAEGWGKFYDGAANGIPVKASGGKTVYLFKSAAKQDGAAFTPASKVKKVSAVSSTKAPKYKVDTKKKLIKYKANTYIKAGGAAAVLQSGKGEVTDAGTYTFWMAATAKKPASAKQVITR